MKKPNNLVAKHARQFNKAAVFVDRKKNSQRLRGQKNASKPVHHHRLVANNLHIIGGQYRSRKVSFYAIDGLRPTASRIRETLFNWLMPYIEGATILDLFAGSGALSFEAASRGAAKVYSVDIEPQNCQQIERTAQQLACATIDVIECDADDFMAHNPGAIKPSELDIVFVDPPFARQLQTPILEALANSQWLANSALIYVEADRSQSLRLPQHYSIEKQKSSGKVSYYLLRALHNPAIVS